ncbi:MULTISPECIES: IS3 family transposase [Micromonospora]|uniref:IS3 family transposase n=1 Tax=Micromonospora TaxID=1873 RepID=UPI0011B58B69|nr:MULTISPECIES: IS3 family transposase [unclassified Micromonospora]MBM0226111.1 IS3 family transposase [Micromonospora sp. ATA51]
MNVYPFIEAEQVGRRNVKRACELLKVSRSAYYQHTRGEQSQRERVDQALTEQITAVHQVSKGTYGAPRVHAELAARGHRHGRKRVARLMRAVGIRGKCPRRWRTTTVADPAAEARPDLVNRDFGTDPAAIDTRWCGDITYINTWEGWLFRTGFDGDIETREEHQRCPHQRSTTMSCVSVRRGWPSRPVGIRRPRSGRSGGSLVSSGFIRRRCARG